MKPVSRTEIGPINKRQIIHFLPFSLFHSIQMNIDREWNFLSPSEMQSSCHSINKNK